MDMLTSPEDHAKHLKQYSGGIALGIAFGMSLEAAGHETPNLINNTASLGKDVRNSLLLFGVQRANKFIYTDSYIREHI